MADYKATAAELASIANAIRLKGGTSADLEYPSEWITAIQNLVPASGGSEITPLDPTAEYKVTDTELTAIANAIRAKGGTSSLLEWPVGFVSAIQAIPTPGPEIVTFANGTDAQIVALIRAAHDGEIDLQEDAGWSIGDERTITISAFTDGSGASHSQQNKKIVISSFNDYSNCGAVMQFDFLEPLNKGIRINKSGVSGVSYSTSEMKVSSLPALANALPQYLKDLLLTFSISDYDNLLALRSKAEVDGSIPFYSVAENRKKSGGPSSYGNGYWLRTGTSFNYWPYASDSGTGGTTSWSTSLGVAPFGCI